MESVYIALFESALLFQSGTPVRYVYDQICLSYQHDNEVRKLFEDLKLDWDTNSDIDELKMVTPFAARQRQNSDFLFCTTFTRLAAYTTMVDYCWKSCAFVYLLQKNLQNRKADISDLQFAQEILGMLNPDDPAMNSVFSVDAGPLWTKESFRNTKEQIKFEEWAKTRNISPRHWDLPSRGHLEKEGDLMGNMGIIDVAQNEWNLFRTALHG